MRCRRSRSTPLEQIAGEIQIAAVAGGAVQLDQRHFEFRMPRKRGPLPRAEVLHHIIGEADAHIEQLAAARGAVIGDGGLDQVAHAVKLVRAVHFGEALGRALAGPVGVQIAAGFLRIVDDAGEAVELRAKLCLTWGLIAGLQHERHGFHPFVDIRVGVERTAPRNVFLALQAQEVIDHAVLLQFREQRGDALLHVDGAARAPEALAHFHRVDGHGVQPGVGRVSD